MCFVVMMKTKCTLTYFTEIQSLVRIIETVVMSICERTYFCETIRKMLLPDLLYKRLLFAFRLLVCS